MNRYRVNEQRSNLRRHFEDFGNFLEHAFALLPVISLDCGDDAGVEVIFQDPRANFAQRRLDCLDLTDDIDAIGIFLHHSNHASQMTFYGL